jgi:hypothetical protein
MVVVNAALMNDSRVALLVAAPNKRSLIVRRFDGAILGRWELPSDEYPTELVAHGDSLTVILGRYDEARLVSYVVGQRAAVRERPLVFPPDRNPVLRGSRGTGVTVLWTPEAPLSRPIPPNYRPRFLVGSDPATAYGIDDDRTRFKYTIRQDPRQAVLSLLPPWEGTVSIDALDGDVYFARQVAGAVLHFSASGAQIDSISVRTERTILDTAEGTAWRSEWVTLLTAGSLFPDSVVALARTAPVPTVRPLIRALHVASPNDMLIVRNDQGPRTGSNARVVVDGVNAAGDVTFRVELPAGASVWDYDGTRLLVRYSDPTRRLQVRREGSPQPVNQIVVLQLTRPAASPPPSAPRALPPR